MHDDVKWLFGLLLVFGAIFFAAGGISKFGEQKPFIDPLLQETGDDSGFNHIGNNSANTTYYYGLDYSGESQGTTRQLTAREEIEEGLRNAGVQAEQIKNEIARLEEARHASPLKGKLAIAGIGYGATDSASEYAIIQSIVNDGEKILITGLRLQSIASGRGVNIPKGVSLFFQNQLNKEESIYLNPGESAYIVTGRSPLGTSLRLNKCTGFLNQFQTFNPSLPSRCPQPREEDLPPPYSHYDDDCRDYINSLPSCQVILNPPDWISPICRSYVATEINYTKCVERHKNDPDFYDGQWQIYLGRDDVLWKNRRELIQLLDSSGKIIDAVTY